MKNIITQINQSIPKILAAQTISETDKNISEVGSTLITAENSIIVQITNEKIEEINPPDKQIVELMTKTKSLGNLVAKNEITTLPHPEVPNKSLIVMPLTNNHHPKSHPISVLILICAKENVPTEENLEALEIFRNIAALILQKKQMHQNFVFTIHQLKTPLTAINGYIQLLYNKYAETTTIETKWIKELYKESLRLTEMIKKITP